MLWCLSINKMRKGVAFHVVTFICIYLYHLRLWLMLSLDVPLSLVFDVIKDMAQLYLND